MDPHKLRAHPRVDFDHDRPQEEVGTAPIDIISEVTDDSASSETMLAPSWQQPEVQPQPRCIMKVIDISRELSPTIAVWPGDQPFERDWISSISEGEAANVGRMRLSLHAGTHADAPFHFQPDSATIDQLDLSIFVGEALLVDAGNVASIGANSIRVGDDLPPRLLFRTSQSRRPDDYIDPRFPHVEPELARVLADRGVILIGTDSPSVDPFESEEMTAHHALANHGIHILENLQLSGIEPGRYLLVAAPLKLAGMDGSPVRAILIRQ